MVATFSNVSRFYTMTIKRCFVTYLCVSHGILLFFCAGILTDPHKQASICLDEEDFKKKDKITTSLSHFCRFRIFSHFSTKKGTKKSAPAHASSQINMD